ncbi:hypothetical protein HPB48_013609 [Haemaphysalis longicornis]|uniref:SWIM-type domain-containing protein n=1 Tax=Haemaphysalis longicornis TaxID=44386 RepID=A0A9J6FZ22_HAELO|nr:hypothetical protein HPB48_013609 [Haemaphysalis longicornis]
MPPIGAAHCASEAEASLSASGCHNSGDRLYVGAVECVRDRDASTSDTDVLRCSFSDAATAEQWVKSYSAETNTTWIVGDAKTGCSRMVFHKVWRCQHHHRNKLDTKRNTHCPAKIDIKIKKVNRNTKKNDRFLCGTDPLPAVIKLTSLHNHTTESADALKLLRPSEETKAQFFSYFEGGKTPAAAIRHHEGKLDEQGHASLANAKMNPLQRTVYYWHDQWRQTKFGSTGNPLPKLHDKMSQYMAEGTDVSTASAANGSWAVLIATPIMQRAQSLESARNIIFVDTTSSCDVDKNAATILLTATKGGAVPIAVLIHSKQDMEGYKLAFGLLKYRFPRCFGNEEAPSAFMSDNSSAEKRALSEVWPGARQLLCHFHVLQAEWRWLTSTASKVPKDQRQQCIAAFQQILRAKDDGELQAATENLLTLPHPAYLERVKDFLKCQEQWVLFHRSGLLTRGQNTNNYSEASIRILKDVVLCRTKAFNAVALAEFVMTQWEQHFRDRLIRHSNHREPSHDLLFEELLQRCSGISPDQIVQTSLTTYSVPSSKEPEACVYEVRSDLGLCSCRAGNLGAFCKHQALVQKTFGGSFPNSVKLTTEDCLQLGRLALGDKCPPVEFFEPMVPEQSKIHLPSDEVAMEGLEFAEPCSTEPCISSEPCIGNEPCSSSEPLQAPLEAAAPDTEARQKKYDAVMRQLQRVLRLGEGSASYDALLDGVAADLSKVNTASGAYGLLQRLRASMALDRRHGQKIKVQPTSLTRRRPGVHRGSGRTPAGRPTKAGTRKAKRSHNLSKSIRNNVAGAKTH